MIRGVPEQPTKRRTNAPATLREVAAVAGVHPATASRALNEETRGLVNAETAMRVVDAATALGYRPNSIARGLKTNRSYTVGVIVPDLRNPLFPPIARGIETRLQPAGYTSLLANTDNDAEREVSAFGALRARQVDGYITATARREHPLLHEIADAGEPMVLVNRTTDDDSIASVVAADHDGMRQAVAHLYDLGHRRIAHLAGSLEISTGTHRLEGFNDAMDELGLEREPALEPMVDTYSESEGARATRELLAARPDVTAIVAGNDLLAIGCLDALREAGLACPDDMSVVGYNDMDWVDRLWPPLTTVHVPHYELGVEAADLLLKQLGGDRSGPAQTVLPTHLVVRASTAPPRSGA
jgi:LacI family transcriptional regulator